MSRGFWGASSILAVAVATAAAAAAPAKVAETVLYQDGHIAFVKVVVPPGVSHSPATPYPSIVVNVAGQPAAEEQFDDGKAPARSDVSTPPGGAKFPSCVVVSPRAGRTYRLGGDKPRIYYRIDYKRVDGEAYGANWSQWYGDVFAPFKNKPADLGHSLAGGKPYSEAWPFDIRYNAKVAAPENHTIRYSDDRLELVEVAIREGETENMHGHPWPSVFADDGGSAPAGAVYTNAILPAERAPFQGKRTTGPGGAEFPRCTAAAPEVPHQVTVVKGPPQHFYRIHFLQGADTQ